MALPTLRPIAQQPVAQQPVAQQPPTSSPKVTSCVWAIVNCCTSGSRKIRYSCFEEFKCNGAFWDINPCADEGVFDGSLSKVLDTYQ